MKTAIYARYSTDMQSEASIEDQIRICQKRIDAEGWTLVETYADAALPLTTAHTAINHHGTSPML